MDVVYVVGSGSVMDNFELRMSIRSLDRFADNLGDIIVVGNVPNFIDRTKVKCIDCNDVSVHGKHWNMLHKIFACINAGVVEGDFLFSADDHFLLKKQDLNEWPRMKRGILYTHDEYVRNNGKEPGQYQRAIISTRQLCEAYGLPIDMTVVHMNMHLNTEDACDVIKVLEFAKQNGIESVYGFEPMVLFNNVYIKKHPDAPRYLSVRDCKCKRYDEVQRLRDTGRIAFSVYDSAWQGGHLRKMLLRMFPNKSRFEK